MKRKLNIGCDVANLVQIRSFVLEELRLHDIAENDAQKIVLAVDEVCANLMIHSNQCLATEQLEINLNIKPNKEICFEIRDQGSVFDINEYKEPELQEIVSSKRKGGLGLMLVKRIMDKIEFATEKNHNICRLIKRIE